jgi:hypothetical protein
MLILKKLNVRGEIYKTTPLDLPSKVTSLLVGEIAVSE